jgi:hypothetical protein
VAAQALISPFCGDVPVQIAGCVGAGSVFRGIADHESIPDVSLMTLENQAQVDEVDVVFAQLNVGDGALAIRFEGVGADTDVRRVPQALHAQIAKHLTGHGDGFVFTNARMHALADRVQRGPAFCACVVHQCRIENVAYRFAIVMCHDGKCRLQKASAQQDEESERASER